DPAEDPGEHDEDERNRRPAMAEPPAEKPRGQASRQHEARDFRDPEDRLAKGERLDEPGEDRDPGGLRDHDEGEGHHRSDRPGDAGHAERQPSRPGKSATPGWGVPAHPAVTRPVAVRPGPSRR